MPRSQAAPAATCNRALEMLPGDVVPQLTTAAPLQCGHTGLCQLWSQLWGLRTTDLNLQKRQWGMGSRLSPKLRET